MSDWYAICCTLGKIESLPGSDFLEITTIMNEYPCIIRKGQFQEGQLVSWLPYDTVVPDTEVFHWLAPAPKLNADGTVKTPTPPVGEVPAKFRTIKSRKIRGTYSEGLIVEAPIGFQEGDSIVEHFGLTKRVYEEELPELPEASDSGVDQNDFNPKTFQLHKYDLDGMAKYGYAFEEGEQVVIHEKMEGENVFMVFAEDKMWVKSRNHFKKDVEGSRWWDVPHRMNMEEKLKTIPDIGIFGELVGGVKGWFYDCEIINNQVQRKIFVFDMYNIKTKQYLEWEDVERICSELGLETVPVLYKGPWKTDRSLHELAEGKSTIGTCVKEGWVMRSVPKAIHPKLGRKIIKLKGRDYKLKKG